MPTKRKETMIYDPDSAEIRQSKSGGSKMPFDLTDDDEKISSISRVTFDGGLPKGSSLLKDRESWYPALSKTIWILEQLRDFVQVRLPSFFSVFIISLL